MANYCDFEIGVHGDPDVLEHFAGYFADYINQDPANNRNEVYVPLDDGTFGEFDEDTDVPYLCLSKESRIRRRSKNECIRLYGWCKWTAPIKWLEQVSNLMPGIMFFVQATIEHELFQEWEVVYGHAQLTNEEVVPLI
jgi:hypothetical protein